MADDCHKNLTIGKAVHKPVAEEGCELCHEQKGNRHAFSYPAKGADLCYLCHKQVTKGKFVHEPLKEGEEACTVCHNAHVGESKYLLRRSTATALCLQCHKDFSKEEMYHKPDEVEKGCIACHDPHASDLQKHLRDQPPHLCYTCHTELGKKVATAKVVHGPLNGGCSACHDPHRAGEGKGLAKRGAAFCVACHAHFKDTASAMAERHTRLMEDETCQRCHDPHAAPNKQLLLDSTCVLCLKCHQNDIAPDDGRPTLLGLGDLTAEGTRLHGPLARNDCVGCHNPHANDKFRFLLGAYPATFYSAYAEDAYGFCFNCHEASLATARNTTTATAFRNGDLNLHYLHVNKPEKGRTCRACHVPHASKTPHFLCESVSFGKWRLPLGFSASENGGTCSSGCHQTKSYDRVHPVSYETPSAPPPPAEEGIGDAAPVPAE